MPDYNAYFPQLQVISAINTQEECISAGGQWNENNPNIYSNQPIPEGKTIPVKGYCNPDFTKQQAFEAAQKIYDRNVFITLVILGAICVALGSFLKINEVISIALSIAGVLSFIIASMRYWNRADDLLKVIILAIALAILIWVAVKKFKNAQQTL